MSSSRRTRTGVRLATGFADHHRTTPVRMVGQLRGKSVEVSRETVASAVMLGEGRFPQFDLSTRNMVEIDLRGLPGEAQAGPGYYDAARAKIDGASGMSGVRRS